MTRAVNLGAHQIHNTGYGRMGIEIQKALVAQGVEDWGAIGHGSEVLNTPLRGFNGKADRIAPVMLSLSTPPHVRGWYEGQTSAILTMWESSEMPAGFRDNLPLFDRVFVPSTQNVDLFSEFHPDVRYVPLGIDHDDWAYRPRSQRGDFVFITGGSGPRKGIDLVAEAYRQVFAGRKYRRGERRARLEIRAHKCDEAGPGVKVIGTPLGRQAEIEWYAQANCYVSGSKGEGWGFMPMQAIAQGCPTILPDHSGHHAFAHLGIPTPWVATPGGDTTFWGDGGDQWVPTVDGLAERMEDVWRHYGQECDNAGVASEVLHESFGWDITAQALILNLPEINKCDGFQPGTWKDCRPRLYHVRVISHAEFRVNGIVEGYDPGEDYWVTWEHKLSLGQLGKLESSCIDPRELGADRAANFEERNTRCPHCRQRFNSDPSLTNEALVAVGGRLEPERMDGMF